MVILPNDSTRSDPAIVEFQGALYVAWTGSDHTASINLAHTEAGDTDADKFTKNEPLNESSFSGPTLAVYNNKLWLAWVGMDQNSTVNVAYSEDGTNFSAPILLGHTSHSPALGVLKDKLFVAWRGKGGAGEGLINVAEVKEDGGSETKTLSGEYRTSADVALCEFDGKLYLAWEGDDADHHINVANSDNGENFGPPNTLSFRGNPSSGVSLASFSDLLFVAWRDASGQLHAASAGDGAQFNLLSQPEPAQFSDEAPALGVWNDKLYLTWRGSGGGGEGKINLLQIL